jgi:hypothetical protein
LKNISDDISESLVTDCEPTDAVVAADISLPNMPSTSGNVPHAFFRFQAASDKRPLNYKALASQTSNSLELLKCALVLPPSLHEKGLTPSQLIFSVATHIDPRALRITEDDEFYLFMDMRAELQWTSFGMTTGKWAAASKLYNNKLKALGKKKNIQIFEKNPRALMDKLNDIEPRISERLLKEDYICM